MWPLTVRGLISLPQYHCHLPLLFPASRRSPQECLQLQIHHVLPLRPQQHRRRWQVFNEQGLSQLMPLQPLSHCRRHRLLPVCSKHSKCQYRSITPVTHNHRRLRHILHTLRRLLWLYLLLQFLLLNPPHTHSHQTPINLRRLHSHLLPCRLYRLHQL
jgi:hypothetical protein